MTPVSTNSVATNSVATNPLAATSVANTDNSGVTLSLVIPAFNESEIIAGTVGEVAAYMRAVETDTSFEIIIIDDGSSDGMADIVRALMENEPALRIVSHGHNKGRGAGVRTGLDAARGTFVICLDADLSYAPEHISRLLAPLQNGEADITLASAYHPEGSVKNVPASRALLSRVGNAILSAGLKSDVRTATCIVRGFRRDSIASLELINSGKDLHLEILQKAELFGLKIIEIPGHLHWRSKQRTGRKKTKFIDYIPFLSMSNTIASHLVYTYVLRPGLMLNIPVYALSLVMLTSTSVFLWAWAERLFGPGPFGFGKIYTSLRETLIAGALTFTVMVVSFLFLVLIIAFYFASQQSKKHHDELYVLVSRMNERLKRLEQERAD